MEPEELGDRGRRRDPAGQLSRNRLGHREETTLGYQVDNAVIMAAGVSSRFAPLSYERPKALIEVRGEVLIERQIRQLREAGIEDVTVVVGYMKEHFSYLRDKLGVRLVENPDYRVRNNHSSIYAVRDRLRNTYICSADNYFTENPFETEVDDAYYAALYADGPTAEWCMAAGADGYVNHVQIGGENAWYMLGHVFWNEAFSRRFVEILEAVYDRPETTGLLWEAIYMQHLDELKLKIRRYEPDFIFEFDSLDELRTFDESYIRDTRSAILKQVAATLGCAEADLSQITAIKDSAGVEAIGFTFVQDAVKHRYEYGKGLMTDNG